MSNKNALAFAVGLGGGYMKADRQAKEDALAEEERQAKAEDRARAREEHGWRRSAQEREVRKQLDLADAAAPRSAIEGSIVTDGQGNQNLYRDPAQAEAAREDLQAEAELRGGPSLADVKPGFGVTGTSLGNKITTQRPDVDAMNTPQDRNRRVIEATQKYDPKEAITLDAATTAAEKARFDLAAAKEDRRTKIEKENWVATVKASQSGDPAAVKAAFNKGGQYMIDGDLKVTPVKSKTPWGDVESFDYEGTIVDKDGNRTPVKINSFAAMADQVDVKDLYTGQKEVGLAGVKHGFRKDEIAAQGVEVRRNQTHQGGIVRANQAHAAGLRDQRGTLAPGYRWTADGRGQEKIPGGPADVKATEISAKREAQRQGARVQADRVIGMADKAITQVSGLTAGVGGAISNRVPGTTARDLQSNLDTIKANLGFAELQAMREASPTGGALGAIAVQELTALQSTVASLDQTQSPDQLRVNLGKIKQHYSRWRDAVDGKLPQQKSTGASAGWDSDVAPADAKNSAPSKGTGKPAGASGSGAKNDGDLGALWR